jgi:hypothetical protein
LIGEPLLHHQTGFDERFKDVPEGWFLDVAGIVLIFAVHSIVVVYQSYRSCKGQFSMRNYSMLVLSTEKNMFGMRQTTYPVHQLGRKRLPVPEANNILLPCTSEMRHDALIPASIALSYISEVSLRRGTAALFCSHSDCRRRIARAEAVASTL